MLVLDNFLNHLPSIMTKKYTGHWFSLDTPVSSTNKTDRYDTNEILFKVAFNTINQA